MSDQIAWQQLKMYWWLLDSPEIPHCHWIFNKLLSPGGYSCLWNLALLAPCWTSVEKSWGLVSTAIAFSSPAYTSSQVQLAAIRCMWYAVAQPPQPSCRGEYPFLAITKKRYLTLPPGKAVHRPSLVESLKALLSPCCVLSSTPWERNLNEKFI